MKPRVLLLALAILCIPVSLLAVRRLRSLLDPVTSDPVAVDASEAGTDFAYSGEFHSDAYGLQVVALGDSRFQAVLFEGGLPGQGWNGKLPRQLDGAIDPDLVLRDGAGQVYCRIKGDRADLNLDGVLAVLTRTVRRSPTLEMPAPDGAIVFFGNGTTASPKLLLNEMIDRRGFLRSHRPGNRAIGAGPITKKKFRDFRMHVEFMLSYMPFARGHARANSGVYLQNRYEIQVLDSFGIGYCTDALRGDLCGEFFKYALPAVPMCYPPLSWQTYDVEFHAARYSGEVKTKNAQVTVQHNGVVIHDKLELTGPTKAGDSESDLPGPIMLQDHRDEVFYRNFWVLPLS